MEMEEKRPSKEEQKKQIKKILEEKGELKLGTSWVVIPFRWWQNWKEQVDFEEENEKANQNQSFLNTNSFLPPIHSSELLEEEEEENSLSSLKQGLTENLDFFLLPLQAASLLKHWSLSLFLFTLYTFYFLS